MGHHRISQPIPSKHRGAPLGSKRIYNAIRSGIITQSLRFWIGSACRTRRLFPLRSQRVQPPLPTLSCILDAPLTGSLMTISTTSTFLERVVVVRALQARRAATGRARRSKAKPFSSPYPMKQLEEVGPAPRLNQDIAIVTVRGSVQVVPLAKNASTLVGAAAVDVGCPDEFRADLFRVVRADAVAMRTGRAARR